jgi:hypothetical protein
MYRLGLLVVLLWGGHPLGAGAQDSTAAPDTSLGWQEEAWTDIVTRKGLTLSYIFYEEADSRNDGIVVRLQNQNDHPIRYAFTILFRGPAGEAAAEARGRMDPHSMQTGDSAGLYWVPFTDERTIGEVGVRGLTVRRAEDAGSSAEGPR